MLNRTIFLVLASLLMLGGIGFVWTNSDLNNEASVASSTSKDTEAPTNWTNEVSSGYINENRAKLNWQLNCQGCHRPDGQGLEAKGMPDLRNMVSGFLALPDGRKYLGRVPGVTNTSLSDEDLAEVLNWMLIEFDPNGIPDDFVPFSPNEVNGLRNDPLSNKAIKERKRIVKLLESSDKAS